MSQPLGAFPVGTVIYVTTVISSAQRGSFILTRKMELERLIGTIVRVAEPAQKPVHDMS